MDAGDDAVEGPPPAGARPFGQVGAIDVDIYVDDGAMRDSVGFAFSARDKLVLGVLVGDLGRFRGRPYTTVKAFIPARKAVSTSGSAKFTREAWEDVKQVRLARYPNLRIVGWMQSLPSFGVVITEMSASLHQSYFDLPHQVLLTVDPVSDDVGFFGWKSGKLERTGFYAFTAGPAQVSRPVAVTAEPLNPGSPGYSPMIATPPPMAPLPPAPPRVSPASQAPASGMSTGATRLQSDALSMPMISAPARPAARRTFRDLLAEHGMASLHRQLHAADLLGKHNWSMDLDEGKITLGSRSFPVQVLGTAADADQTWLWGWANAASGIPDAALYSARELQRVGNQHRIRELTEPLLPLTELDPAGLTLVAAGVCSAAFYYRAAYEGGAAYLLIPPPGLGKPPAELQRASTVITQFIADHPANHRDAVRHFMRYLGFPFEEQGPQLVARTPTGALTVQFDGSDRVVRVQA